MAITAESIPIKVRSLLTAKGQDVSNLRNNRILALQSNALQQLSHQIAQSPRYVDLQKDFPVTPTLGVIDLSAIATIIFDLARSRVRIAASNLPLYPIDFVETQIYAGIPNDKVTYSQDGQELRFRDTNGVFNLYSTAVKIKANWVLALSDIPPRYEDDLIKILATMVSAK